MKLTAEQKAAKKDERFTMLMNLLATAKTANEFNKAANKTMHYWCEGWITEEGGRLLKVLINKLREAKGFPAEKGRTPRGYIPDPRVKLAE